MKNKMDQGENTQKSSCSGSDGGGGSGGGGRSSNIVQEKKISVRDVSVAQQEKLRLEEEEKDNIIFQEQMLNNQYDLHASIEILLPIPNLRQAQQLENAQQFKHAPYWNGGYNIRGDVQRMMGQPSGLNLSSTSWMKRSKQFQQHRSSSIMSGLNRPHPFSQRVPPPSFLSTLNRGSPPCLRNGVPENRHDIAHCNKDFLTLASPAASTPQYSLAGSGTFRQMYGLKRPYPFSPEVPPPAPFLRKSPYSLSDYSASCSSESQADTDPTYKYIRISHDIAQCDRDFLTLSPPAPSTAHHSLAGSGPSGQENNDDQVTRPGPNGSTEQVPVSQATDPKNRETDGLEGKMTPPAFEEHAQKEGTREWKHSIWVTIDGDKVPIEETALLKYYNLRV